MRKLVGLILLAALMLIAGAAGMLYAAVNFNYGDWGSYYTVPYADGQYFAGYAAGQITSQTRFTFNTTSDSGELHIVRMDDNIRRDLNTGYSLSLGDGYQFKVNDIDVRGGIASISLLMNGNVVDTMAISEGRTYVYTKRVGSFNDFPLIAVHVSNITNKTATIDGVFQISEMTIGNNSPLRS